MKNKKNVASHLFSSAQDYILKSEYKVAETLLLDAIELLDSLNNIEDIMFACYKELILCYIKLDELSKAKSILDKFELLEKSKKNDMNLSYTHALYYEKTGNLEKALIYYEKQFIDEGKIVEEEKQNYILELQKENEVRKTEQEKEIFRLKNIELKRVNFAKDKFLSIVAHDLKSPFATILSFISIMKKHYKHYTKAEIENLINELEKSVLNTYSLLKNLLEWSRLQSGTLTYNPSHFDLYEIIKKVINLEIAAAEQKSISIINNCKESVKILADVFMIETVIRNLVANSIKFTNIGGIIEIFVQIKKDTIRISVKDNGIGIDKESLENLFKLETSFSTKGTQDEKGTGLGLILCREFIEKNKGKLFVESEVGKGTLFYFDLLMGNYNEDN